MQTFVFFHISKPSINSNNPSPPPPKKKIKRPVRERNESKWRRYSKRNKYKAYETKPKTIEEITAFKTKKLAVRDLLFFVITVGSRGLLSVGLRRR